MRNMFIKIIFILLLHPIVDPPIFADHLQNTGLPSGSSVPQIGQGIAR